MKKALHFIKMVLIISICVFSNVFVSAQLPAKISYQAVIRDNNNNLVALQAIGMQISILQDSVNGTAIYTETHNVTTNTNGLVSIEIGNGTTSGNFSAIDWADGPFFIRTAADLSGGANYNITGTSQILGVPFAFFTETSNTARSIIKILSGELGITSGQLAASGISAREMVASGIDIKTMFDGGINVTELLGTGITVAVLVNADLPVDSLTGAGITTRQLLDAGEDIDEMLAAGITLSELLAHEVTIADLLTAGVTVPQLVAENVAVAAMLDAGITAEQLVAADEDLDEMLGAGISVASLLSAGVKVSDMLGAGVSVTDLFNAGIMVGTLQQQGAAQSALISAGLIGTTPPDGDGNTYSWVRIGDQYWMSEDMKTNHYTDGTPIPDGTGLGNIKDYRLKYYFSYNDDTLNAITYGYLYTHAAAVNGAAGSDANPSGVQGVCPSGWHVPGDSEWKELEMHLGMSQADADINNYRGTDESEKLKETGTVHWGSSSSSVGTNESGFTGLPGGFRMLDRFTNITHTASYWTSTKGTSSGCIRSIYNNHGAIYRNTFNSLTKGLSVRCVKD
ncbi:MAG: hypothetical protein JXB00_02515 [Bacteroidales bacterium]|nr:hypothetical protein [Bacteroidales bacterium]